MIVFHILQSRILITSAIANRLLVYPNLNARLKTCQCDQGIYLDMPLPNLNSVKNRDIIKRSNNFVS